MANIGPEHISYMAKRINSAEGRLAQLRHRFEKGLQKGVRTAEVAVAGMVGGVIQGHAGEEGSHIFHVPTDLGLGLALNVLGFFRAAGDYSDHLHNLGDGFLASFTSSVGFGWGNTWRATGKFSFSGGPKGLPAATKAAGEISPAEMANIVSRVRAATAG